MRPFFGYPGGKSKATKTIKELLEFNEGKYTRIVEPFCGGASLSLSCDTPAWLNDVDADLMCLWVAVRDYPDDLREEVRNQTIYPDLFFELREIIKQNRKMPVRKQTILHRALQKLTIHKLSYSNMGEMAASPVGGKNQTGKWKYDVRWNVPSITSMIRKVHKKIENWDLTCWPYEKVFHNVNPHDFVFIDPPYFEAGSKCYKNSFSPEQHQSLARRVWTLQTDFAVTYDNQPEIIEMYDWASIADLEFKYFMSTSRREGKEMKTGKELLITNES